MQSVSLEKNSISERAKEKLRRDMGPLLLSALADRNTVELMLNPDGKLWQEKLGEKMQYIGDMPKAKARAILETVAGFHGKTITHATPLMEGEFPLDGSRFAAQLPPIVQAPSFAIRKKAIAVYSLDDYVRQGVLDPKHREAIGQAVLRHKNILVIGGTGSGKTTLVNAIIKEMVEVTPGERVVIIEDTAEIQCHAENHLQFHTSLGVSMTDLLKTTLRMRPDRILVGEVRDGAALDLLDAWNTGHEGGAATLHANHAIAGLQRLNSLITRNPSAPKDIDPLIGEAVHMVVHIARHETGRRVNQVLNINGYENGKFLIENCKGYNA